MASSTLYGYYAYRCTEMLCIPLEAFCFINHYFAVSMYLIGQPINKRTSNYEEPILSNSQRGQTSRDYKILPLYNISTTEM